MEIMIRNYDSKTDDGYIYSTWTKFAFHSQKKKNQETDRNLWFKNKCKEIHHALSTGTPRIACLKEFPFMIIGYIVEVEGKVIWTCVKKDYHNQGIEDFLQRSLAAETNKKGILNEPS
jgi:hypothetical protein